MEWDSSEQQLSQMTHSPPIWVCCFPVAGTPMLPQPHHECKPNSECGQSTVLWSWSSPVRLGEQGRDVFVALWCAPAQEQSTSVINLSSQFTASEPPPAPLFTVHLEIPVPVELGGTQCSYSSSSCAGKNNFSGFSLLTWNVSTTWTRDLFLKFLSHRKQPPQLLETATLLPSGYF